MAYLFVALQCAAIYGFILLALRFFGKREVAQLSLVDLVFMLLISNAVQNAMVGSKTDFIGGIVAATTLFALNFLLKRFFLRNPEAKRWLQGEALVLVYKGVLLPKHLALAELSEDEVLAAVREHGIATIPEASLVILETDGNISVLSEDIAKHQTFRKRKHKKQTQN